MNKLPSHTLRYFAEQCYSMAQGKARDYKTVYGVVLTCQHYPEYNDVLCTYELNGKTIEHRERVQKQWRVYR